jgi:dipeptidase E
VRLYLSSFRLGTHAHRLVELVGKRQPRVLAVMNALDNIDSDKRDTLFQRLHGDFADVGLEIHELDLRDFFASPDALAATLSECDLVWANGGNAFTLRAAMRQSGFDRALHALLARDVIVYGGYSAGAVVATPSLRGIELVDTAEVAEALPPGYQPHIVWEGLGLVPYSIAPHYRSDHFESEKVEHVVAYFQRHDVPYRALRDGEAILVDGDEEMILTV